MDRHKILVVMVLAFWIGSSSFAATIPGRWEKVDSLPRGTPLLVEMKSGDRMEAFFQSSDADGLVLLRAEGDQLEIPKSAVKELIRPKANNLWNGAAVGAGIGAASYLIGHIALCCAPGAHDIAPTGLFAAAGLGIGALVDLMVKEKDVLYVAP